ncbi:MAG: imidazoleglycerol-phosphate dehydratase HisB [Clostridia bacterium]|nr:imidazoleglycerol-phosphate dehydratase HisB [Clostridia bacterium]
MREYSVNRKTNETDIKLYLNLDGTGKSEINSGCGFLDHMLTLFASHGRFDLNVNCIGDINVDDHHTVEDIGIALGAAFENALGDKRGITRYGNIILPMDEALILCAVDISGRDVLSFQAQIPSQKVGTFDTELTKEFFLAFVRNCKMALHIQQLQGENSHHIIEGMFKAFGRVMRTAVSIDSRFSDEVPSTKGVL